MALPAMIPLPRAVPVETSMRLSLAKPRVPAARSGRVENSCSTVSRGSFVRRLVESLALLGIAAGLLNTFALDGWLVPEVVSSGSMAPALLGPHRMAHCDWCGFDFPCDAEEADGDAAVCPNCNWPGARLSERIVAGDRMLLDRATLRQRPVQRWELIVFRLPEQASELAVKRAVGLPGETVELRDGAVLIDGAVVRRSLAEQRAQAILVHDSAHWPRDPKAPQRWRVDSSDGWQAKPDGAFVHRPASSAVASSAAKASQQEDKPPAIDWLAYVHWQRELRDPEAIQETPIRDDDSYNPATSRKLNNVRDLLLVAQLSAAGVGELTCKIERGDGAPLELVVQPASGKLVLRQANHELASAEIGHAILERSTELAVSTFDNQLLVALDGRVALSCSLPPVDAAKLTARPFALGARDLQVDVRRLTVWRGVYYTTPRLATDAAPRKLGPDEYFVLGDNSPVSVDSRTRTGDATITSRLIVGRPIARWRREP